MIGDSLVNRTTKGLLLLGLVVSLSTGCSREDTEAKTGARRGGERPATPVVLSTASVRDLATTLDLTGTLAAEHQVDVSPRQSGRLVAVTVNLGDRVAKGQVLARLDDVDLRARLSQTEAALASAQATLRQREIEYENLARQADRDKALLAQDFIARQDYDNARTRAESAKAMVSLSQAEIARQRAAVREAQEALRQAVLVAPVAGTVSARLLDVGAMATPGSPVVSLVAPGDLKAVVQVPESALPKLKAGTEASVTVDAWPETTFTAKVRRVAPAISTQTRTGQVELAVADVEGRLRPGMFARVSLTLEQRPGVVTVPRSAIVTRGGQSGVWIAEDGKAAFVPVQTGLSTDEAVELTSGLPSGAAVITLGNHQLTEGAKVQADGERRAGNRAARGSDAAAVGDGPRGAAVSDAAALGNGSRSAAGTKGGGRESF